MSYTLQEIAQHIDAVLEGDPDHRIDFPASLEEAGENAITFAEMARYCETVRTGLAGAVVVSDAFPEVPGKNLLRTANPRVAFLKITELFAPTFERMGINPNAIIHPTAQIGTDAHIEACTVIEAGARIGDRCIIQAGAYIGKNVIIGDDIHIEPNTIVLDDVTIGNRCTIHAGTVIGGEGFGYRWIEDHHHKVPQLGKVIIEDDVDIGCNCCIDKAALGTTHIQRGTKIDNQVQIGHNCKLSEHVILCGQVGIAGSVEVGRGAILAGGVGVADHVNIGERAVIGVRSVVTGDIASGTNNWGTPARTKITALKETAAMAKLPELIRQIQRQQTLIDKLQQRLEQLEKR